MNIIKDIEEKIKFKKSKEYLEYKQALLNNKKNINKFLKHYIDANQKVFDILVGSEKAGVDELKNLKNDVQRWYYQYVICLFERDFIRPNTLEDIKERKSISNTFSESLVNILGEDSNFKFYGTPIYLAKKIIEMGLISSTFSNYINSSEENAILLFSITELNRIMTYFVDYSSYLRCLPCGVLFVLNVKDSEFDNNRMQNFDFKENSNSLVSIVCTSEVKDMIKKWCIHNKIDENKVLTYFEFLEYAKNNNLEKGKTLQLLR